MDRNFSVWQYQQKVEPVSLQPETTTPDKWLPQIPHFARKSVIIVALIPTFFAPPSDAALQNEVSKYGFNKTTFDNPIQPKRSTWTYPYFFADAQLHIAPGQEVITVDKWHPLTNERIRIKENHFYKYGYFWPDQISTAALEAEKSRYGWRPNFYDNPRLPQIKTWVYPYFFADSQLYLVPGAEIVTVDKWFARTSEPVLSKKNQWIYPWIAEPPSTNALESEKSLYGWQREFNRNPVLPRTPWYAYPYFMADSRLHDIPGQFSSVTVEQIGFDLFAEQARPIELFVQQTITTDLFVDQSRSFDLER